MVILMRLSQIAQIPINFNSFLMVAAPLCTHLHLQPCSETRNEIERITKIINDHPFPDQPLRPTLLQHISPPLLSNTFLGDVLGRLFAAHTNGLKALEFFKFCLHDFQASPTPDAFEKTLHILARMRYFDQAWELMREIRQTHPSLLTLKSMSILLSKIAKFQSYEDTIEAFRRMENEVFVGRKFGTEDFNVLLRAFCTQRQMKEARSVFQKMYSRFPPNTKTMNLLLLGFKESSDVTAVELFYHEMIRRGFKPNAVTYSIRIDAYCKRGCFSDGLRVFEEMERAKFSPTLETITTLIHGAGVAKDITKACQLFDEITLRNLSPDTGVYNALISSFIRSEDVKSAAALMEDMEAKHIGHDSMTYHMMFLGLMRSADVCSFHELYNKMIGKNFVPKTRTVVMLMKFFCENRRVDLGLDLWGYLVEKGYCPHSHALDLLVTGLCARGVVLEAFQCSKQMLERGRQMSEAAFLIMERSLLQADATDKLGELEQLRKKLKTVLPPPKQLSTGIPASSFAFLADKGSDSVSGRVMAISAGRKEASRFRWNGQIIHTRPGKISFGTILELADLGFGNSPLKYVMLACSNCSCIQFFKTCQATPSSSQLWLVRIQIGDVKDTDLSRVVDGQIPCIYQQQSKTRVLDRRSNRVGT